MKKRESTSEVVFHHAAFSGDVSAEEVRQWHLARGFSDIGYHFVVRRNGSFELGRDINLRGAHDLKKNHKSIGILICGDFSKEVPTTAQLKMAANLFRVMKQKYGNHLKPVYHRSREEENPCPGLKFPREYFNRLLAEQ